MKKFVTMVRLLVAGGIVSLLSLQAFAAVGDVYELKEDFSTTSNPNTTALGGTWAFLNDADEIPLEQADNPIGFVSSPGWDLLGGAGVPAIWSDFTDLFTTLPFDPTVVGTHSNLLVRWTSAETGFAHVSGYYFQDDRHPPPDRILGYVLEKNGVQIDTQGAVTSSTKLEFDQVIPIAPGDNIDMRIFGDFPGAETPHADFGGLSQRIEIVEAPPGVDGDYNNNGTVDAADYTVWRDQLGENVTLPNDSTPGMVTTEDYAVWKTNFGNSSSPAGSIVAGATVPEPGAMVLLIVGMVAWPVVRGHRQRRRE